MSAISGVKNQIFLTKKDDCEQNVEAKRSRTGATVFQ